MAKSKQTPTGDETPAAKPARSKAAAGKESKEGTTATKAAPRARKEGAAKPASDGKARTAELRRFVDEHPGGWEHGDWVSLLERLREQGHDTSNQDEIGAELERERLARSLSDLPGLGPRRVQVLAEHFGTIWELRHASPDEIAAVPGVPRALAERISETVR